MAIDRQFEIKPNDPAHMVKAPLRNFPREGTLLSIAPHMHFRGKSFTAKLEKKNPKSENKKDVLLSVPQYDFNWQHIYQFSEPVALADVRSITAEIVFDNSTANPFNPDPEKYVTWGDQTWEEMAIGFFDISVPREPSEKTAVKPMLDTSDESNEVDQAKVDKVVKDFFDRFDADQDGVIMRSELPLALRTGRGYSKFNTDGKRGLTKDEVSAEARRRLEKRN